MIADRFKGIIFDPKKSKGQYIYDSFGKRNILDMGGFFGSSPIGHNHPDMITPSFIKKMGTIAIHNPSNSDFYTKEMAKFCSIFKIECMKDEFKHLFLISGGALAVENALKAAFDYKMQMEQGLDENELEVVHFTGAFHGRSGYTMSLTNTSPDKIRHFPKFSWPRFDWPTRDLEGPIMDEIEIYFKKNGRKIAAIIAEPIQGEGGDRHMSPEFWRFLRTMANHYNTLLIADEVQTGLSTGKVWGWEHFIEGNKRYESGPDLIAFGKKFQVCGVLGTDRIDKQLKEHVFNTSSRINSTFGSSLTDMARSTKYLEIIRDNNLIGNSVVIGMYLTENLSRLAEGSFIKNVRGKGHVIAFDVPTTGIRNSMIEILLEQAHVLVLASGERSIRIRPKLDFDVQHANIFLGRLEYVMDHYFKYR